MCQPNAHPPASAPYCLNPARRLSTLPGSNDYGAQRVNTACQRRTARRLLTPLSPPCRQLLTSTLPHPTYAPLPLPACCSSILEKCEAADNIALRHVQRPRLAELGIEPLIEDAAWEARCRVQVRAVLLCHAVPCCAVLLCHARAALGMCWGCALLACECGCT